MKLNKTALLAALCAIIAGILYQSSNAHPIWAVIITLLLIFSVKSLFIRK